MGRGWVYVGGWLTGGVDVSGYVCVGVAEWGCCGYWGWGG